MTTTLFKEKNGQLSSVRIMAFFVVSVVVGTWAALSIMRGEFVEMPIDQVLLVLGAMGIKVWQRGKET